MRSSNGGTSSGIATREHPLTAEQLRQTIEALLQIEVESPPGNAQWSELRMVRKVLSRMLIEVEADEEEQP